MNEKKPHNLDTSILRAYDIRGEWQKTLHPQDAFALGYTLAERWRKGKHKEQHKEQQGGEKGEEGEDKSQESQVLVARDGRTSSPALSQALLQGLRQGGVAGIDLGILPTPALYFAEACRGELPSLEKITKAAGAKAAGEVVGAVMVTGSHNPPQHNGFKLVREGKPFFGQDLQDLAESMAKAPSMPSAPSEDEETACAWRDACRKAYREAYTARLLEEDARSEGGGLSAVWDLGAGAACVVAEDLLPRLQGEHHLLFASLDGSFAARSPDPAKPHALDRLREEVIRHKAQVGLAFDGDADRLVVLTSQGKRLSGDRLLLLFATDLLQNNLVQARASAPLVLCDIKTSPNILRAIEGLGGRTKLVPTGHAHIKRALAETHAAMAGEVSGHLFFNDRYGGYDDALYAAVRLCAMLRLGFVIERALEVLPSSVSSDELRLPVEEDRKFSLVAEVQADLAVGKSEKAYSLCTLDGVRVERTDGSWWLLRASNTEAALVLRAEAREAAVCRALLAEIEALLRRHGYKTKQPLSQTPLVDG